MSYRSVVVAVAVIVLCAFGLQSPAQCVVGTNGALTFDGVNDECVIPSNPLLSGFSDFTIEVWYRSLGPNGGGLGWGSFVSQRSPTNDDAFEFGIGPAGLEADIRTGSSWIYVYAAGVLGDQVWHHAAFQQSGSTLRLYLDGALRGTASVPGHMNASSASIRFGGLGAYYLFNGQLDEVRIWNLARTQAQIQSNMTVSLAGNEPGLVGYWRFDEGAGQVVSNNATSASTTSPPSILNGTLGVDGATGSDDPTWTPTAAPLPYCPGCAGTTPQPNSPTASLVVNGVGGPTSPGVYPPGPFFVAVPTTGPNAWQLSFSWAGPPGSPLVIVTGALAPCSLDLGCSGRLDIAYTSLGVLFDGTMAPMNLFFTLGPTGTTSQTFVLPALPPGPLINLQGAVIQPGCFAPVKMTAAFQVSI